MLTDPVAPRNLVNASGAGMQFAARTILSGVTLGVDDGQRIGVVGANGSGKSTLLQLLAGTTQPDAGTVTRTSGLRTTLLDQRSDPVTTGTVTTAVVGDRPEHEWAGDRNARAVIDGLLGGTDFARFPQHRDTQLATLSGGERRRVELARALIDRPDLLLLDEPTNHLDIEGVSWLAAHLNGATGALLLVTHDRWFLDAVCTVTWEVADAQVHRYDGGYSAFVLARAERERIATAQEARRQQLIRKELAWLRRGPPARTAKPRFRIEAAEALIADEPPVRDSAGLLRFASRRLDAKVIDAEAITFAHAGGPALIDHLTWRIGPGDRIAIVGVNGSGKSTLLKLIAGELAPQAGTVERSSTVRLAHLAQSAGQLPEDLSAIAAVQQVRGRVTLAGGEELTAGSMLERLGLGGEKSRTRVGELSGGERRRLELARLLIDEPNVLLLDEPTNDIDTETLAALEDLLDRWAGTLVLVSHDRYFVERVVDNVFTLEHGTVRHLPGGIDQYLREVNRFPGPGGPGPTRPAPTPSRTPAPNSAPSGARRREARRLASRLERELDAIGVAETALTDQMAAHASDHVQLAELSRQLHELRDQREAVEADWLTAAEAAEA